MHKARVHNVARYNAARSEVMGPDWQQKIQSEVLEFAEMLRYLRVKGVKTEVLLLPQGTWEDNLPFDATYCAQVEEMARSLGVPVVDDRRLLDDDSFADSSHLNPNGVETFQNAVLGLCLDHLRATGALPASR